MTYVVLHLPIGLQVMDPHVVTGPGTMVRYIDDMALRLHPSVSWSDDGSRQMGDWWIRQPWEKFL